MALFTDTRELNRQARNREFNPVTGLKKTALAALGYKADGTKNWWGNTVMNNPIAHYASKHIAGKESDTGEVIDSSETESWQSFGATAKMALNIITLGQASAATSAATAATTAGTTAATTAAKTGTETMAAASEQTAKDASMDALNNGYSEQTIDGVTTTSVGGVDLSEEDMVNWQKYMEDNPGGTIEDFQATQEAGKKAKQAANAAKITKNLPIIGDAVNMVATRSAEEAKLKNTKRGIRNQQNLETFNYL